MKLEHGVRIDNKQLLGGASKIFTTKCMVDTIPLSVISNFEIEFPGTHRASTTRPHALTEAA